jgi:hypothetical protein
MNTTVVNIRGQDGEHDVYIGRGPYGRHMLNTAIGQRGWLGNPHTVERVGMGRAIQMFREDFTRLLETDAEFLVAVMALRGKRLGCYCKPRPCHGDVIAEFLDSIDQK